MKQNFEKSLELVLKHEGGFANHPKDPGGATMKGVTQAVYDDYRRDNGQAEQSVRHISNTELKDIYRRRYWDKIKGDELPSGVDYAVFDGAVNSGPSQSAKWMQRALNDHGASLADDGVIGPATLAAMDQVTNHAAVINLMLDKRLSMLRSLSTWSTFGKGWSNRVSGVRSDALTMATHKPAESEPPPGASPQPETSQSPWAAFFMAIAKLFGGRNV